MVSTYDWAAVTNATTVDEKLENFTQIINSKVDKLFPQYSVKYHTDDKPFVTGKIKNLIEKRDKAYTTGNRQHFKLLRNRVTNEIKKEKKNFYERKVKPLRLKL